eukprot:TRINITY_DN30257_c0_g1_i1.p2 TRINITY_DN30257_c0_g1~~TRINITY_DN30257_c0_g1_i1.p2  ORF type:complete len:323 (+),score=79.82 TRINITY_DN30257_c0_g1_i1:88-1056(+)
MIPSLQPTRLRLGKQQRTRPGVKKLSAGVVAVSALSALSWQASRTFVASEAGSSRRAVLVGAALGGALLPAAISEQPAEAFPNRVIAPSRSYPRTPGPEASDLGLLPRGRMDKEGNEVVELKSCEQRPNCFSTTNDKLYDRGLRAIDPWTFEGKSPAAAMAELREAIESYEPGQRGVDGGGFELQKTQIQGDPLGLNLDIPFKETDLTKSNDFIWVLFEENPKGHCADVEFALKPGTEPNADKGSVLVRSASRVGYFDRGANAARLNFISEKLRKKGGWKAPEINGETHPRYWGEINCGSAEIVDQFPEYCVGAEPKRSERY